jgi:hypothetical protein
MSASPGYQRKPFKRQNKTPGGALRFPIVDFKDLALDTDPQYLVKGLLPRSGVVVVWGPPKCGKSFWVYDLTMHVALGREYRGLKVKKGRVVYCALEGAAGFKKRIEAFRQKKLNGGAEPLFKLMSTSLALHTDHKQLIDDIRAQLNGETLAILCLDTLNRSMEGSESSDEDMTAYLRAADAVRQAFDCLVIIIHHCGHDGQRPRGHSSLIGGVDVQIAVSRAADDSVVAELELAKDGEVGLNFISRLERVEVGVDVDGEVISSCVVEALSSPSAAGGPKPAKRQKPPTAAMIALRALHKAINEVGQPAPASNTIPPQVRVAALEQWQTRALMGGISTSSVEDSRRRAFDRAHAWLVAEGLVGAHLDYIWVV